MKCFPLLVGCGLAFLTSGCLTVEYKEYRVTLKSDHSGEATIRFINILSESDDSVDVSREDFRQLIEFYLEGSNLERENPGFHNVKKRLFEQDGQLVGELSFTFDSLSTVRLFRYNHGSPIMYFVGNPLTSEQLIESNGERGPDWMPVVFWERGARELYFKTRLVSEVPYQRSLLKHFHAWEADPESYKQQ